jgi:mono/diheme cytochrome c family protein
MKPFRIESLFLPFVVSCLVGCESPDSGQRQTAPAEWNVLDAKALASSHGRIDFETHVKPILSAKCVICHNRGALPIFSMENRQKAFEGGPFGQRILPGKPNESALVKHITSTHMSVPAMPPLGQRLTADEVRILTAWVKQGSPWPSGKAGDLTPRNIPEP